MLVLPAPFSPTSATRRREGARSRAAWLRKSCRRRRVTLEPTPSPLMGEGGGEGGDTDVSGEVARPPSPGAAAVRSTLGSEPEGRLSPSQGEVITPASASARRGRANPPYPGSASAIPDPRAGTGWCRRRAGS